MLLAAAVFLPGCSGGARSRLPSAGAAHQAVEAALTAWKEGKEYGPLPGTTPQVDVSDSKWRDGEKLNSFAILREEISKQGAPVIVVQLTVEGQDAPQEVRYVVVGKDRLWVAREDDAADM
jgi:hypothetical protein